jgi:Holliday junction resolvase RusA-like endonuclease
MIRIELDEKPVMKSNSYRIGRGGRMYVPKDVKEYDERLSEAARRSMKGLEVLEGRLKVRIVLTQSDKRRRDLQNLAKGTLDSLNEIVYKDDSQIDVLVMERIFEKGTWKVVIEVEEIE